MAMKKSRGATVYRRVKLLAEGPNGKPVMLKFYPGAVVAIHEKNSRQWPRFTHQTLADVLYAISKANEPLPEKPISPQLEFPFGQFKVSKPAPLVDLPISPPVTQEVDRPF